MSYCFAANNPINKTFLQTFFLVAPDLLLVKPFLISLMLIQNGVYSPIHFLKQFKSLSEIEKEFFY